MKKLKKKVIASGLPASPGAASGKIVFSAEEAERLNNMMQDTILVRIETSPEDIHGMHAAKGILTSRGGMTSHAAVVARGMGRPCVSGTSQIDIDYKNKLFKTSEQIVKEGDIITIDGSSGKIILGEIPTVKPEISEDFSKVLGWADEFRKLKIRTNSETPLDTKTARDFGAEGIGLCRTEHMFFDEGRILHVRQMILSKTIADRNNALDKILPYQKNDFKEIFKIMSGLPVTVRLLDPPLHEFLPKSEKEIIEVANSLKLTEEEIKIRINELHEHNPMLGHRGCRLGISYPEIYEMQCRAIFEALVENKKQRANDIAIHADFFSFGTNDLTQTTFGISRDDSGKFLNDYIENKIFEIDPFISIDKGVGELVALATKKGRKQNKKLKLGICGEHGGDPKSIHFCARIGLNYVSCSPFRVPIARLAAAQAALTKK